MWITMRRLSISEICKRANSSAPYPSAIERHQYHAMKPSLGRVDEGGHFFRAQDAGQWSRLLRVRCIGHAPGFLDRLCVEEPQSRKSLRHAGCGQLSFAEQIRLVLANVLRSELIRRAVKVTRKILDRLDVAVDGSLRIITTLEFFEHHFAKLGHRESPYDPTLSAHRHTADTEHAKASAAKASFKRASRTLSIHAKLHFPEADFWTASPTVCFGA